MRRTLLLSYLEEPNIDNQQTQRLKHPHMMIISRAIMS
ncbi:hypothetical protein LINPERHAP2_LOCUS32169 [Linum perenne]